MSGDDYTEISIWEDGTIWARQWLPCVPGLLQLCWTIKRKGTKWASPLL